MSDDWLGEIRAFSYSKVPSGWHQCDGTLLQVSQNNALFSLLGNRYGGDGRVTFALPDLRGRVPLHMNPADSSCAMVGQTGGMDSVTLTTAQIPAHTHIVNAATSNGNTPNPAAAFPAAVPPQATSSAPLIYGPPSSNSTTLNPGSVLDTGTSQGHENRQPTMALNWCICISGVYPTRD
jgi:microcystin-dependent protein